MEFALLVPLLLVLFFGIVELGRALYQLNTLTKATDAGVRYLSRGWAVLDADCNPGPGWEQAVSATARYVVHGGESTSAPPLLSGMSVSDVSVTSHAAIVPGRPEPACVLTVSARANFNAVLGDAVVPFTNLGPIVLRASKEGRYLAQ